VEVLLFSTFFFPFSLSIDQIFTPVVIQTPQPEPTNLTESFSKLLLDSLNQETPIPRKRFTVNGSILPPHNYFVVNINDLAKQINEGSFLLLHGPCGSGKTTLCHNLRLGQIQSKSVFISFQSGIICSPPEAFWSSFGAHLMGKLQQNGVEINGFW
jgi:ABC-type microcin C transport system duplicated ATPase subunit YejF